jgi:hypothetical protein
MAEDWRVIDSLLALVGWRAMARRKWRRLLLRGDGIVAVGRLCAGSYGVHFFEVESGDARLDAALSHASTNSGGSADEA